MFIASANVSDDRRASEREVLEYECCSDIVDMFQSMHSFVEDSKRKLDVMNAAAAESMAVMNNAGNSNNNCAESNNNNNNQNVASSSTTGGAVAGGAPSTTTTTKDPNGLSPTSSPSTATTFPHVSNAVINNNTANSNENNINNIKKDENNNTNSTSAITSSNSINNNNTATGENVENNTNNNVGENIVLDAVSKLAHVGGNNQEVPPIGELVDTTQSAVFNFPSARPQDCIKPIYLVRKVGPLLTLVVGVKNENVDSMRSATEYNIDLLEKALMQILKLNEEILRNSQ